MHAATHIKSGNKGLPLPGPRKRNPEELDKILDKALEDGMAASDSLSTVMPEVKERPDKHNP